jgi:hypothetical protein
MGDSTTHLSNQTGDPCHWTSIAPRMATILGFASDILSRGGLIRVRPKMYFISA